VKARSPSNTAVSVSLDKVLLEEIDARARKLGLTRSRYLALLARKDLTTRGPLILPSTDGSQPPVQVDLTQEAIEFLKLAIPALQTYEDSRKTKPLPSEPPEPIANPGLWEFFIKEADEILKHKWCVSQELGYDIGMEKAITEWVSKHYPAWSAAQPPADSD
jgi:hypothetical protein